METGRINYKGGEEYEIKDDGGLFEDRISKKTSNRKVQKKLGPRQIGRTTSRPDYKIDDDDAPLFADRIDRKGTSERARKKEGPRQTGRIDYNPKTRGMDY